MGIFSRKGKGTGGSRVVPADEVARLSAIGRAVFLEGQHLDVSGFYLPGFLAAGPPTSGSPEYAAFVDRLLDELVAGANSSGDWAFPGALHVARDFLGADGMSHPQFVELVDRALPFMASVGVSGSFIPMFLQERWSAIQLGPA
jgi:hypothetical protein